MSSVGVHGIRLAQEWDGPILVTVAFVCNKVFEFREIGNACGEVMIDRSEMWKEYSRLDWPLGIMSIMSIICSTPCHKRRRFQDLPSLSLKRKSKQS